MTAVPDILQKFFNPKRIKKITVKEFTTIKDTNVGDVINYKMRLLGDTIYDYNWVVIHKDKDSIVICQVDNNFNIIIGGETITIENMGSRKNPKFIWRYRTITCIDTIIDRYF